MENKNYTLITTPNGYVVTSDEKLEMQESFLDDHSNICHIEDIDEFLLWKNCQRKVIATSFRNDLPKILNTDQLYNMWREAKINKEAMEYAFSIYKDIPSASRDGRYSNCVMDFINAKRDTFTKEDMIEFAEWCGEICYDYKIANDEFGRDINKGEWLYMHNDSRTIKTTEELLGLWQSTLKITEECEVTIEMKEEGITIKSIII